jgi:hypothetical protein
MIAISEDDDTVKLANLANIPLSAESIRAAQPVHSPAPEKGLILGWNSKALLIIKELEEYVAPGSELLIVSKMDLNEENKTKLAGFRKQHVIFQCADASDRQVLDRLDVPGYQHVIVLAYEDIDEQSADAATLITLLHLRDIAEKNGSRISIVSEMLDLRNRRLAEVARADDFIVSDHLISLMLSQLSENGELSNVFADLFDAEGSELYLKPITDYVELEKPVSFYTVVEAARRRNETAVGYRVIHEANDASKSHGIYTNPKKSQTVTFSAGDRVVVLADSQ